MKIHSRMAFLLEVKKLHGFQQMLSTLWTGLTHLGSERLILIALSEPKKIQKAIEASVDHDFHFASPAELKIMQQDPENKISDIDIHRVKNNVSRCLVQMDGEKLTGYAWIWNSKIAYISDGVYINLPADTIYNYKALTVADYRGFAFQGLRHINLLRLLQAEGITRLFGFVNHLNTKSLHGVKKSGYKKVGELLIRHGKGRAKAVLDLDEYFWAGKPAPSDLSD